LLKKSDDIYFSTHRKLKPNYCFVTGGLPNFTEKSGRTKTPHHM